MNDCSNVSIAKLTHDMFRPDVWIRYLHRAWEFPFPIFYNNSVGIEMDTHFIGIGSFINIPEVHVHLHSHGISMENWKREFPYARCRSLLSKHLVWTYSYYIEMGRNGNQKNSIPTTSTLCCRRVANWPNLKLRIAFPAHCFIYVI